MRLTRESVDWVKQTALDNVVDFTQSTEDCNRNRKLSKREQLPARTLVSRPWTRTVPSVLLGSSLLTADLGICQLP